MHDGGSSFLKERNLRVRGEWLSIGKPLFLGMLMLGPPRNIFVPSCHAV